MQTHRPKILLVDDQPSFYEQMKIALAKYEVRHALNTHTAGIALNKEKFDLVLLDLNLDETKAEKLDGLDYLKKLRKKYPILPVIVMSQHNGHKEVTALMRDGATDYYYKGHFVLDVWRARIQQAIDVKRLSEERHPFVGSSQAFALLKSRLEHLAATDDHVLLSGGIGVGKTSAAHYFYAIGKRRYKDFRLLDLSLYDQESEVELIFEKMKSGVVLIKHVNRISHSAWVERLQGKGCIDQACQSHL